MIELKNYEFDPVATFECGQCFRWNKKDDKYIGIAENKICCIKDGNLYCSDDENEFWGKYFCLEQDYSSIRKELLKKDKSLKKCMDYGYGIRILKQSLWETVISFIISANNNIPRIKGIIERLSQSFGEEIFLDGEKYYSFPTPQALSVLDAEDLAHLRAGYRDRYILDAASKFASGEISEEILNTLSTDNARKKLMEIKGVGGKVADCILLFSLERYEVFPKDVWIKRIMKQVYNVEDKDVLGFAEKTYGEYGGFAQQYLFYYHRDKSKE